MKTFIATISAVGFLVSSHTQSTTAFVSPGDAARKTTHLTAYQNNDVISCNRLSFLKTIASVAVTTPLVAVADGSFEDLAMPSADEQKAEDVSNLCLALVIAVSLCLLPEEPRKSRLFPRTLKFPILCELGVAFSMKGENMQCVLSPEKLSHTNLQHRS